MRVNYGPPPPRSEGSSFSGARRGGDSNSSNRLYVGNLAWGVDNLSLENLFSEQGKVLEAKVVYDRDSGRSRGFGFVTYDTANEMNSAIESLDGVVSISLPFLNIFLFSFHILFQLHLLFCVSKFGFLQDLNGRSIRVTAAEPRPRRQF